MSEIFVFGASGHGKVVIDIIEKEAKHTIVGILDDNPNAPDTFCGYPILGGKNRLTQQAGAIAIAIGNNGIRHNLTSFAQANGWQLPSVIHPETSIARGVEIGDGVVIMPGAVINTDAQIGNGGIINTGATVDHECQLGPFVQVSPGCTLCGNVIVGEDTFIGAGTTIIPGINIGSNVTVGAGSLVIRDISNNNKVMGSPAHK